MHFESFDDIRRVVKDLPDADEKSAGLAAAREAQLTKPAGALGRLEDLAGWLAAWQGRHPPVLDRPLTLVFAGNHGVVARGVSAFPPEVTRQMVANFAAGGAAINQLCRAVGSDLKVIELDLNRPTEDFTGHAAMTEAECLAAVATGAAAVADGTDVLLVGEMGIGNTTSAAALCCGLFEGGAEDWVGPGTGLDRPGVARKARVVAEAITHHGAALDDPWEALRRVGGRELAAMAGAILSARLKRIPVVLDGFVCSAAAAVLFRANPAALDHCVAGHCSAEPGHRRLLTELHQQPLLELRMRLGEASGAAVALGLLRAAVATHTGMATFGEAGVSGKE